MTESDEPSCEGCGLITPVVWVEEEEKYLCDFCNVETPDEDELPEEPPDLNDIDLDYD